MDTFLRLVYCQICLRVIGSKLDVIMLRENPILDHGIAFLLGKFNFPRDESLDLLPGAWEGGQMPDMQNSVH